MLTTKSKSPNYFSIHISSSLNFLYIEQTIFVKNSHFLKII
jgi:hypothetical protein